MILAKCFAFRNAQNEFGNFGRHSFIPFQHHISFIPDWEILFQFIYELRSKTHNLRAIGKESWKTAD